MYFVTHMVKAWIEATYQKQASKPFSKKLTVITQSPFSFILESPNNSLTSSVLSCFILTHPFIQGITCFEWITFIQNLSLVLSLPTIPWTVTYYYQQPILTFIHAHTNLETTISYFLTCTLTHFVHNEMFSCGQVFINSTSQKLNTFLHLCYLFPLSLFTSQAHNIYLFYFLS